MGFALYRKYRPQKFAEVTGQNHVKTTLQNELAGDAVAHAYLLTGPRGVGKTSMARIFAKALNCLDRKKGESEPCGKCASCLEQTAGRSLDVVEIDAASNTGVDNVRENIIEHVRFAPSARRYKIFIIDEVHMLSVSAWNALLKTLEEPPAHAIFVMCTTEAHKVPATIVSRCQRFDFRRIPAPEMAERLKRLALGEGVEVTDDVIKAVVGLSDGCLRDAESMFEQVLSLGEKKIGAEEAALVLPRSNAESVRAYIDALAARRGAEAVALVSHLVSDGVDLMQFTNEAIEYSRGLLLAALGAADGAAAPRLGSAHLMRMINSLLVARNELRSTPIPQLPLEMAAAEHCGDAFLNPPPAVEAKPLPAEVSLQSPRSAEVSPQTRSKSRFTTPLETVVLRWDELCAAVREENPSLPFLLRVARPLRVEDGVLVIGVQYKMHAEKLNSEKNRCGIVRGLTALYGNANISVRAEIAPEESSEGTLTNSLLSDFGGAVVE